MEKKLRTKSGNVVPDYRHFMSTNGKRIYIVANRSEATIYQIRTHRDPREKTLEFVMRLINPEGRLMESEMNSDRPGRGFSSAMMNGSVRHALDQRHVRHEKSAEHFAAKIAAQMDSLLKQKMISEVVVAAEPKFLGLLRKALPPSLSRLVKHEINREFTQLPEPKLYELLQHSIQKLEGEEIIFH
jgi:protein required for attachment to host cells